MGSELSSVGAGKTPLKCALDHFNALMDPGTKCKKRKLVKLCKDTWPLYHLGQDLPRWPREGTLGLSLQHLERYLWQNSRTAEIPYLHIFFNLSAEAGFCQQGGLEPQYVTRLGKLAALTPRAVGSTPPKILFGGGPQHMERPEEEDFPPPYVPPPPTFPVPAGEGGPARAPGIPAMLPPPEAAAPPLQGEGGIAPQPTVPVIPDPRAREGTPTALPPSPSIAQPSDSDASQPADPSPEMLRKSERSRRAPERFTSTDPGTFSQPTGHFPLRQVPGPSGMVFIHTPFSTADLYSWKQGLPPYRESPQQYVDLISRIISTHRPDIPDLFALLSALLNEEERRQVMAKAYEAFSEWRQTYIQSLPRRDDDGPLPPTPPTAEEILCLNPPPASNDPNTEFGKAMMEGARHAIREGLKKGVPRIVNYQKVYNTVQTPEESPAEFLTRLKDAYRRHTDVDPEDPGNLAAIRTTYIAQAAPDIRKKLQKLPAPATQPMETLVQTAFQVYYQRPEVEELKAEQKMKKKASLLAAAMQPYWQEPPRDPAPRDRAPRWGRDRDCCHACGSTSHWIRDCPSRGSYRRGPQVPEPNPRYPSPWERRDASPPRRSEPRSHPQGPRRRGEEGSVPLAQGNRYPCEIRAAPSPTPRTLLAATEGEQD